MTLKRHIHPAECERIGRRHTLAGDGPSFGMVVTKVPKDDSTQKKGVTTQRGGRARGERCGLREKVFIFVFGKIAYVPPFYYYYLLREA